MKLTLLIVAVIISAFNVVDANTTECIHVKKVKVTDTPNSAIRSHGFGIFGGTAAKAGAFGFQAALYMNTGAFCGGSLIDARWILTAAHCLLGATSVNVILGSLDSVTGSVFGSQEIIIHGMYNTATLEHDIGLVKLSSEAPVKNNKLISTIKLQGRSKSCNAATNGKFTATDWGYIDNIASKPIILQSVAQEEISNAECFNAYSVHEIPPTVMCTTGPPKNAAATVCSGGGPLFSGNGMGTLQVGIVSFGIVCGDGIPSGFTRVGFYLDWLTNMTNIEFK